MSFALLTSPVFYRIDSGIVFIESTSGKDEIALSMPIGRFRQAHADAAKLLRKFDAELCAAAVEMAKHEPPKLRIIS